MPHHVAPRRTGNRRRASGCAPPPPARPAHARAGRWDHRRPPPAPPGSPWPLRPAAAVATNAAPAEGAGRPRAPGLPRWLADRHARHRTDGRGAGSPLRRQAPLARPACAPAAAGRSMRLRALPVRAGCPAAGPGCVGTGAMHCSRRHPGARPRTHCAPVPAMPRFPHRHCVAPATDGQPLRLQPAAPAVRGPVPVPVHCPPGHRPASGRGPVAALPRRYWPGPGAPAGDRHPVPAPPGSARVHRCHQHRSGARRPAPDPLRPAAVRSAAHPRTNRPAACAAGPAARTPPALPAAPSARSGAHGAPAATTNAPRGGRGPAPDVQRHAGDAGARVPCVQG